MATVSGCAASCAGGQAAQRSKTERGSGARWIDESSGMRNLQNRVEVDLEHILNVKSAAVSPVVELRKCGGEMQWKRIPLKADDTAMV